MAFLLRTNILRTSSSTCKKINFKTTMPIYVSNKNTSRSLSAEPSASGHIDEAINPFHSVDQTLKEKNKVSRKNIIDLHKYLKAAGTATPSQSLLLIRCCGFIASESQASRSALLQEIWKTLFELDVQLDVSHHNAALKCFVDNDHEFSSEAFLEDMTKRGIEPNRVTFTRLIHKLCKDGKLSEANEMLELMKEKDMTISKMIFNSLIIGNARVNDLEGSLQVIDIMKENGLQPDEETYLSLALAYTEHQAYEKLDALLQECESKDLPLSDKSLISLIYVLARKNATKEISKILNKLSKTPGFHKVTMMCCIQLLQEGHYDIAYQVVKFKEKSSDLNRHGAKFFPEKLVQYGAPFEELVRYCNKLVEDGINVLAFETAFESSVKFGEKELALKLLQFMKKQTGTLRDHYFYPLFCIAGKGDILNTLQNAKELGFMEKMMDKWTDIILPAFEPIEKPFETFYQICDLDYNKGLISRSIIHYFVNTNKLEKAAILARNIQYGTLHRLERALAGVFISTNNVEDTVAVARLIIPAYIRNQLEVQSDEYDAKNSNYLEDFLKTTISQLQESGRLKERLLPLLQEMKDKGVGICRASLEPISNHIGKDMTPELESLLNDLVTTTCINDQDFRLRYSSKKPQDDFNLFRYHVNNGSLEKAKQLLEKFEADGLELPSTLKYFSAAIFFRENNLAKVEEIFESLLNVDFSFSPKKIIQYAWMLVNEGRISDASKVLLMYSPDDGEWLAHLAPNPRENSLRGTLNRLFDAIVEKGDLYDLELIQKNLISRRFHEPSFIYGSTILYHVNKGDLESAVNSFAEISDKYDKLTKVMFLFQACAQVEDTENLQKIADIIASKYGRTLSLMYLACASLRVGKYGPAEKIFKTPGLRDNGTILKQFENMLQNGYIEAAEKLLSYSVNVYNFDRKPLFMHLLKHYASCQDTTKALELWTSIQEDNDDPGEKFMYELSILLKNKGTDVPFVIPVSSTPVSSPVPSLVQSQNDKGFKEFFVAINSKNFKKASQLLKSDEYSKEDYLHNLLIIQLLNNNHLIEAVKVTQDLLNRGGELKVIRRLLDALALKGYDQSIEILSTHYDELPVPFQSALGNAYYNSKRMDEYLNKLKEIIIEGKFRPHYRAICRTLLENPDFEEKLIKCIVDIPDEYKSRLWSCIWDCKFYQGHKEEAEEIYDKYLKDDKMYVHHHKLAIINKDIQSIQDVLDVLKRNPEMNKGPIGAAYSSYIQILRQEDKIEEAIELVKQSLDYTTLEAYISLTLVKLKKSATKKGITFPYELPKNSRMVQSLSDTSSDSESD